MCKKTHRNNRTVRDIDDDTVIKSYHVKQRTNEAIRRLSLENNMTEGRVIDHIIKTHLASLELDSERLNSNDI